MSVGTTAIMLAANQKAKTPKPVVAVPTSAVGTIPAPALGPLIGDWTARAHAVGLSVKPDGTFTVFVPISDSNGTTHASGHLATTAGTAADGEITQSDNPFGTDEIPLGAVRLALAPDNDTVQISLSDAHVYTFCGPKAPPGLCG